LRNVAAHADLGGLVPEDIPYLEALVGYILDHLYVIPASLGIRAAVRVFSLASQTVQWRRPSG